MSSNSGSTDSLADALTNMSEGKHKEQSGESQDAPPPDVPQGIAPEPDDAAAAPAWDLDADEASATSPSSSRPLASRRPPRPSGVARFGVKASMVIGMLLLIPAIWAVLVLAGVDVLNASAAGADRMALLMLICWPIALALIGGSFHFGKQLARQQAAYDQSVADEQRRHGSEQSTDADQ